MIFREDLNLSRGKAACKLGQAMIVAFSKSPIEIQQRYLADGEGTQIALSVTDEEALLRMRAAAAALGCALSEVHEDGIFMAIGIGPVARDHVAHLTDELPTMT